MLKQAYIIKKYRTREYARLSRKIFGFYARESGFAGWMFVTYSIERIYDVVHSRKNRNKEYFLNVSECPGFWYGIQSQSGGSPVILLNNPAGRRIENCY